MTEILLQHIPEADRPRERLWRSGPEVLSAAELLAVLLGSGTQAMPVLQLAHEILKRFGNLAKLADATLEELCQIPGIGQAKAIQLKACFALGARAARQERNPKTRIEFPSQAYALVRPLLENEKRELLLGILLDLRKRVIALPLISAGTLSQTLIHPREIFYLAIRHKAASLILAHNHPSGDPTPSPQDREITKTLVEAGQLMGIPVTDHLILGEGRYVSMRQMGFVS